MSGALAVVGLQWGDEGKGKIVDWLSESADFAVRFQGGNNAGHTITVRNKRSVLHLVPSGALRDQVTCLIGQGVVLNPGALLDEIDELKRGGCDTKGRIFVSGNCSLILPYHIAIDEARERKSGNIGTTKRGIGPAYEDKVGRRAMRLHDLFSGNMQARLEQLAKHHNHMLSGMYGANTIRPAEVSKELAGIAHKLQPLIADIPALLSKARQEGKRILLEGAQGALLDFEHGTYPFVTSSSCLASAAVSGTGANLSPRVLGIAKAYATRVGNGPFPTEADPSTGALLLKLGNEFGATTGRERRCGWLDIPALRYALGLNGCQSLCLTKLDVLDELDEIPVCIGYETEGRSSELFPVASISAGAAKPIYERLPGWKETTSGLQSLADAPSRMQEFIERIEELCGARIRMVSIGADREQTLQRDPGGDMFN